METNKQYVVTHEQLRDLEHFQNMFDNISMEIKELCKAEKSDIEYGFQLGGMYYNLRSQYLSMINVVGDIHKQIIKDGN